MWEELDAKLRIAALWRCAWEKEKENNYDYYYYYYYCHLRSLLCALPLATLCYYHDFYCHLRSLRSHLGSRPVGRGPPASLLGLIGRWRREDRSCPDARRKEGAREEEGRATAAAPEEGGRATAAAPPSSKVQGHPSNSIGDNRVGDTSDTTRVGDISDTGRAPVQHSRPATSATPAA